MEGSYLNKATTDFTIPRDGFLREILKKINQQNWIHMKLLRIDFEILQTLSK